MRNLRQCPKSKKNIILFTIKGHNSGTIKVRYFKILVKPDLKNFK